MAVNDDAEAVLDFWLRETPPERRFARDDDLDAVIACRFGALHARLAVNVPEAWTAAPRATLAAIVVLDQFSRNLGRGTAAAFVHDATARALTRRALARGDDAGMTPEERQFLYMPLMHSESVDDQADSVARFEEIGDAAYRFALAHQAVIARFGRFPHRNAALDRRSTPDEVDFIASDSGF